MGQVIGLIPARGGSKGIPRKNLQKINGQTLLSYTVAAALKSQKIDRVVLSTDDEEIAEEGRNLGCEVPFLRPSELAQDSSGDLGVVAHALEFFKNQGEPIDLVAYLRPTSPLKTAAIIDAAIDKLRTNPGASGLRSLTAVEGVFHPYWMYELSKQGEMKAFCDINPEDFFQRQTLPPCYRLNGVVDVMKVETIQSGSLYGTNPCGLEIEQEYSLDIDTQSDLEKFRYEMEKL